RGCRDHAPRRRRGAAARRPVALGQRPPRGPPAEAESQLRHLSALYAGRDMAHLLGAEALHLEFPTRVVFDSVSLGVDEGDRIGVVGRNGDGKSSLLRMLAGLQAPDAGRVTV